MRTFISTFSISGANVRSPVPRAVVTVTANAAPDALTVRWDRPMSLTGDIKGRINVLVNGSSVAVSSVTVSPVNARIMKINMAVPFGAGDVITWQYTPAGGALLVDSLMAEAGPVVHPVNNKIDPCAGILASSAFFASSGCLSSGSLTP